VIALLVQSCQQVWNKLLTTCNKLDGIIRIVARLLQQVRYSHDITILLQPRLCRQPCNILVISWLYQTCSKVVQTRPIQSWYNNIVTTLCRQTWNILVISWLYRTCQNNFVTSLIMPSSLLQGVNSLFRTCYSNWEQAVRTQLVDNLWTDL
jgi:hypothetical protein